MVTAVAVGWQWQKPTELVLRSSGNETLGQTLGSSPSGAPTSASRAPTVVSPASPVSSSRASTPATPRPLSGVAMPVGDLTGWHQAFREDFTTAVGTGSFPGTAYASRWKGYEDLQDASGTAEYATSKISSVHDGALDVHLHTEGGHALVAAAVPLVAGTGRGQRYGRYVVRYRADPTTGYSVAFVLWPDSNNWADGEVDFPQGSAGGPISGSMRCPGAPTTTCLAGSAGVTSAAWHTATVEWAPGGTTFLVDGKQVAHSATTSTAPLHWVLQAQTGPDAPAKSASGHVLVDWVTVYTRA